MVAADRQRQQSRADQFPAHRMAFETREQGESAEERTEQDRDDDQYGIPRDGAGHFEGGHAGIVHRGDAASDNRSSETCPHTSGHERDAESDTCQGDGGQQGQDRQRDVVSRGQAGSESQHRDEMRCPDAEPGGDGSDPEPKALPAAHGSGCVVEKMNCREGCKTAHQCCQGNEPEVVLLNDAVIDRQHDKP